MKRAGWLALVLAGAGLAPGAAAQDAPQRTLAARAFDLERSGNYAGAVNAYRALLESDPVLVSALLGLERSLSALSRLPEMSREIGVLMARTDPPPAAFPVAVRVWTAAELPDSARRAVERWAALEPGSEEPWQVWGEAAASRRNLALARTALLAGRNRLGRPQALAAELAQLASQEEDYPTAVAEWVVAMETTPEHRTGAEALLGQAPAGRRAEVRALLAATRAPAAARVAAVLTARWGDPLGGFEQLKRSLPTNGEEQVRELAHFRDEISGLLTPAGRLASGRVLEALGVLHEGEAATRYWLDAAQAFSDAGDAEAARRTLARLAGGSGVPVEVASRATVTLVGVLVDEGRMLEADRQLAALRESLGVEDLERLSRRIARGWIQAGDLERAAAAVAADSSVDGLDLAGRIQVFRGDLAGGSDLLKAAGPFTGSREDASSRVWYLALLQVVGIDSLVELGQALLALEQGDTLRAAGLLEEVGGRLPAMEGGAELALLSGRLYAGAVRPADAERLWAVAAASDAPAAAAAAGLELARLEGQSGRTDRALTRLEALILAWPGSSVAPDARRLLDTLRGTIPAGR